MLGRSFDLVGQGIDQTYCKRCLALPVFPVDPKNGIIVVVEPLGVCLIDRHPFIVLMDVLSNLLLKSLLVL